MRYTPLEELKAVAEVVSPPPRPALSAAEKTARWVALLEARRGERLSTLPSVEYISPAERLPLRRDNSPLTVAFNDSVLREAGLRDDTYGEAMRFFELSHNGMHRLVCRCQFGAFVPAERVAKRLQGMTTGPMATLKPILGRWMAAIRGAVSTARTA